MAHRDQPSDNTNSTSATDQVLDLSLPRFTCEDCRESFRFEHHLVAHRNYGNCGGGTSTSANQQPERNLLAQEDTRCPKCNRHVHNRVSLAFHIAAKHNGIKPLVRCKWSTDCGLAFTTVSAAMRHIRRVHFQLPVVVSQIAETDRQDVPNIEQYLEVVDEIREIIQILKQQSSSTSSNRRSKRRATEELAEMEKAFKWMKTAAESGSGAASCCQLSINMNTSGSSDGTQPPPFDLTPPLPAAIIEQYRQLRQAKMPINFSALIQNVRQYHAPWIGQLRRNDVYFNVELSYYYGEVGLLKAALPHFNQSQATRNPLQSMGSCAIRNELVFLPPAYEAFVQNLGNTRKTVSLIASPYGWNWEEMLVNSEAMKTAFSCERHLGCDGFVQIRRPGVKYNIYAFYVDPLLEEVLKATVHPMTAFYHQLAKLLLIIEACPREVKFIWPEDFA